jgi:glycosyltransferase involved in cell wall biosynthesis
VSLAAAGCEAEIVVVDDGSTDNTPAVLAEFQGSSPFPVHVITQSNRGKFHTRRAGVRAATADFVVLLDSRLILDPGAITYLLEQRDPSRPGQPWNGHVITDPEAPGVGHFWTVTTYGFWGSYLARPKPTLITAENFDRVPKGTGLLAISRSTFEAACAANLPGPNAHLESDDTKILRWIVDRDPLRLEPGFAGMYRPRTTFKQFISHAYLRGTLFVDSYAGTSPLRSFLLVLLAMAPWVGIVTLAALAFLGKPLVVGALLVAALVAVSVPAAIATTRRCPPKALAAYALYIVPFGFTFAAGLLRGIVVHRDVFKRSPR